VFAAATLAVDQLLRAYSLHDIAGAISAIPAFALAAAAGITLAAYVALVGYDYVAFRWIDRLRAVDLPTAAFLLFAWGIVSWAGPAFPRAAVPAHTTMGPSWRMAVATVLLLGGWTAVLLYRHAELDAQVWWRFALSGQAPRALRHCGGVGDNRALCHYAPLRGDYTARGEPPATAPR
jgi:lysylphosphatidylglycerol synthetase-like protein (DUF2156 family)